MSSNRDNLRDALRLIAEETQTAGASPRVRLALEKELRGRRRKSVLRMWWPAAAVAAACLMVGIWLGSTRQEKAPNTAAVVPVEAGVPVEVPAPAAQAAPMEEPEAAVVQPVARRATYTAPAAGRAAQKTGVRVERPVSPWYFYTGLPAPAQGQVVRVMVSAQTAAQYGVPALGTSVPAQVFIGDDGLARAIRFVR